MAIEILMTFSNGYDDNVTYVCTILTSTEATLVVDNI